MANGPPRILIADDEFDTRKILSDCLKQQGFEVVTACDGKEALTQALAETGVRVNAPRPGAYERAEGKEFGLVLDARGWGAGGQATLSPAVMDDLQAALRVPRLLGEQRYGDALRIYAHEQMHAERPDRGPHHSSYEDLNEGLADLGASERLKNLAQDFGHDGPVNFFDIHRERRDFVTGLLEFAPGNAERWRKVKADELISIMARDVGKNKANQVERILRRSLEPQIKLRLIRELLI